MTKRHNITMKVIEMFDDPKALKILAEALEDQCGKRYNQAYRAGTVEDFMDSVLFNSLSKRWTMIVKKMNDKNDYSRKLEDGIIEYSF